MKYLMLAGLMLTMIGCGSDEGNRSGDRDPADGGILTFDSLDLSGTWKLETETRTIRTETGEYMYSSFIESTYILEDTDTGVKYDKCWDYGDFYSAYGVKTVEHLYLSPGDISDTGFTVVDENTLVRNSTYQVDWYPGFEYEAIETLTRTNAAPDVDSGTFILRGPVSIEEYNHVCLWEATSTLGESRDLEILVPYGDDFISLELDFYGEISAGSYSYNSYRDVEEIELDVYSNSDEFWEIVGSNTLAAEDVTIDIIDLNDARLSGVFSLLGQDGERYTGEFEVFFDN